MNYILRLHPENIAYAYVSQLYPVGEFFDCPASEDWRAKWKPGVSTVTNAFENGNGGWLIESWNLHNVAKDGWKWQIGREK